MMAKQSMDLANLPLEPSKMESLEAVMEKVQYLFGPPEMGAGTKTTATVTDTQPPFILSLLAAPQNQGIYLGTLRPAHQL